MTRKFWLAAALSLAIALGGLVWMDGARAEASSYDGATGLAAPVSDAEACSTTGWYAPGYISDGGVIYVPQVTGVASYPYYYPVVTYTTVTLPAVYLPSYGSQPYTEGTVNNYACNAFSNCVPVADQAGAICPGNPAAITLNSSLTSATCGSATSIDAKVVGPSGLAVADGTPVLATTTLGMVPGATSTTDGIASLSLVFPPKTTGVATLTIMSGTAKTEAKITVTC